MTKLDCRNIFESKKLLFVLFLFLGNIQSILGASDGAAGITSLIPPAVNFFLFSGLLFYLLARPTKNFFYSNSKKVEEYLESADAKFKEAEILLSNQESKLKTFNEKEVEIEKSSENDLKSFESNYKQEIQNKILRVEEEFGHHVEAEKKKVFSHLESELIFEVINETKKMVKGNSAVSEKIEKKLLKNIN